MSSVAKVKHDLRAYALTLPGAWEDFPWGETALKVGKKVFVFLGKTDGAEDGGGFSVKLPDSAEDVLALSCATPTGYGLGKAGWVSITLVKGEHPPIEALKEWVEESYRAIATKRLVKELDARRADG